MGGVADSPPGESTSASDGKPSRSGLTAEGLPSAQSMREAHQAWADAQITTSSCMFCGWKFEGPAGEGRERAKAHREKKHPEACIRKARRRGSRITKRSLRSSGENEQAKVDAAEANRVRAEREQAEMLAKIERGRLRAAAAEAALDGAV